MLLSPPKYNDVILANDFVVCDLCAAEKAHKEYITKSKASREIQGNFVGKYCLKIGDIYICEDCLSKTFADIAVKKQQVQQYKKSLGDDIIESMKETDSEIEEKMKPKPRKRKKVSEANE